MNALQHLCVDDNLDADDAHTGLPGRMYAVRVRHDDLVWDDPQGHMAEFDLGYARYGFCRNCGATLYFQASEGPDEASVMIGLFEDASGIELHSVWFTHEVQDHNQLDPNVPHHAGNE